MAHFYGTLAGYRGKTSRLGTKDSGLTTTAAGWKGAISVTVTEVDGIDYYTVSLGPWQGSGGEYVKLASGKLDARIVADDSPREVEACAAADFAIADMEAIIDTLDRNPAHRNES